MSNNKETSVALDALRTYIDEKMKRFYLLFAVHGASFAIGKLIVEKEVEVLGVHTLIKLSIGVIIFDDEGG